MASFKKAQEMLLLCLEEEMIDGEEFALLYTDTHRGIVHFLTRRMIIFLLQTKIWPNVKPIFAWRKEIFPYLLKP